MIKSILVQVLPKTVIWKCVIAKKRIQTLIANIKYLCLSDSRKNKDCYSIPIIINNFNRLDFLRKLISSLEIRGYSNIYIIDNNSSFPPLLEYYKQCPYTVFRLNKNVGYKAIWETGIYEIFKRDYYVYTDSDMQIDDSCPKDFMMHFVEILKAYPTCQKVGFGIRIDNLPDTYINKSKVIEWEKQFWQNEIRPGLYQASIDTTFALYRPYCKGEADSYQKVFRTGSPYLIRHLPWYAPEESREEEIYYTSTIKTSTHWSYQNVPK